MSDPPSPQDVSGSLCSSGMPGIGTWYEHDHPVLANLQYFTVSRYQDYIVFHAVAKMPSSGHGPTRPMSLSVAFWRFLGRLHL
jgi:hypothetical protein